MRLALTIVSLFISALSLFSMVVPDPEAYRNTTGFFTPVHDDDFTLCSGLAIVVGVHHRAERLPLLER